MVEKIKQSVGDVMKEMKKVSWPTKTQLRESTGVVLITCAVFALFCFVVDFAMKKINEIVF